MKLLFLAALCLGGLKAQIPICLLEIVSVSPIQIQCFAPIAVSPPNTTGSTVLIGVPCANTNGSPGIYAQLTNGVCLPIMIQGIVNVLTSTYLNQGGTPVIFNPPNVIPPITTLITLGTQ